MQLLSNPLFYLVSILATVIFTGCATTRQPVETAPAKQEKMEYPVSYSDLERPIPYSIDREIPWAYYRSYQNGTRTPSGEPGSQYWQQRSDHKIDVELRPEDKRLEGSSTITYYNNAPDTLNRIVLELAQNVHGEGVPRNEFVEVTGGYDLKSVVFRGDTLKQVRSFREPGYIVSGTRLFLNPIQPVLPESRATIETAWSFKIPQQGAGGRMGYSRDNLFYIAYFYPKMMVYDDVYGWFSDNFTSNAEFYHEFGNYEVDITVPAQWVVEATGTLQNAEAVFPESILERYHRAAQSDSVVRIIDTTDFGSVTKQGENGTLTWHYTAENVRDFAFSVTKESIWEAARTSVGDRDGNGQEDFIRVGALYRETARHWTEAVKFAKHSITFLSEFTGLPYPWPHMTSVEGAEIIGGGMEFPMMTVIGSYNWSQNSNSLYYVIAHEFAHMWVPMIVSTNERRYSWMDEGTTTFNENQARKDFFDDPDRDSDDFQNYLNLAGSVLEGEIMRWSDYHYPGGFGVASYPKPAAMLVSLRGVLGEETFLEAYRTYLDRWKYKHPYPWDFFNTFEDVSGRDLDWFWRSWYYETWILDQAVAGVSSNAGESTITIADFGEVPMPAEVQITLENGTNVTRNIEVETWLNGATETELTIEEPSPVTRVEIDPEKKFPDANRSNNVWQLSATGNR